MEENFGFIITRHVNSEKTNNYWNQNVKLIRTLYPFRKIVIIDDNSDRAFLKEEFEYKNVIVIQSEYPRRGELLPFIYFLRNRWFKNAVIIHDGVFIHKKINFSKFKLPVMPLWHFPSFDDNPYNTNRLLRYLKNNYILIDTLNESNTNVLSTLSSKKWHGVFGCQCYINHDFLTTIQNKYNIENLIHVVNCRTDRCSLERIFGIIFNVEYNPLYKIKSLFGSIQSYQRWGYNYDEYVNDFFVNKKVPKAWVKVWTGR